MGRPHLDGLALAGAGGVRQVLENLLAELELMMASTGGVDVGSVTDELLQAPPRA